MGNLFSIPLSTTTNPIDPKAPHSALWGVSSPQPPHSLFLGTNWAKFSPFYNKMPQFKKENKDFPTAFINFAQSFAQDLSPAPSVFLSQLIQGWNPSMVVSRESLSDLCRAAKILWVLSSSGLFFIFFKVSRQ